MVHEIFDIEKTKPARPKYKCISSKYFINPSKSSREFSRALKSFPAGSALETLRFAAL